MGCNCKKKATTTQPKVEVKPATPQTQTTEQTRANVAIRNRRIIRRVAR